MLKSIRKHTKKEKWMYQPKEGEQFFFMHIPKTGGTTFRQMLTNHFPEGSYYPTQEDLLSNNGGYLSQKELVNTNLDFLGKSLVMGHYNVSLIKHLHPNVKVIAFFRNPIDRILSHVRHILLNDPEWQGRDPNLLIEKQIQNIHRVQSNFVGHKNGAFNTVANNIKKLHFIGILEYFEESIELYNKEFDHKLDFIDPHNTSNLTIDNLSAKSMSLITRSISIEIETYKRAFEQFKVRCENENINLINSIKI